MGKFSLLILLGLIETAIGLSCHRCGTLSPSARNIRDCEPNQQSSVEECGINEACVVFKRLYKKGSASIRGCYPVSDTLPGLRGAQIFPQRDCDFQPKRRSPVKVCMCTTDLCNDMEYDIHSDRARRLFNQSSAIQPDLMVQPSQRKTSGPSTKSGVYFQDASDLEQEEDKAKEWPREQEESLLELWDRWDTNMEVKDEEVLSRVPRQAVHEQTQRFRRQNPGPFLSRLPVSDFLAQTQDDSVNRLNSRLRQFKFFESFAVPDVICPTINVLGATYALCDGEYRVTNEVVDWAPDRPVYRHESKDRYVFWNAGGLGWSIGKRDYLNTGSHWHRSGLDSDEPWQGPWERGVMVNCVEDNPRDLSTQAKPEILNNRAQQRPNQAQDKGPVNCLWSSYGAWSSCSVSCGSGVQQRKRMVLQEAENGGTPCRGDAIQSQACSARTCPVDCEWSNYGDWSRCSASCGGGVESRERTVLTEARNGGRRCIGRNRETRICNAESCSTTTEEPNTTTTTTTTTVTREEDVPTTTTPSRTEFSTVPSTRTIQPGFSPLFDLTDQQLTAHQVTDQQLTDRQLTEGLGGAKTANGQSMRNGPLVPSPVGLGPSPVVGVCPKKLPTEAVGAEAVVLTLESVTDSSVAQVGD
eukprot:maker-scaffold249_size238305-snap-gene-1.12 protein:Tk01320 transcript:maker-scaffold249_size238305-snap-gene-1.12-mRNA-1 annotation:"PREDICTED: hemicentin-1-like"